MSKAFPKHPAVFKGPYTLTLESKLRANTIAIIHLVLKDIPTAGTPAPVVYEYLRAFYKENKIVFKEVVFNVDTLEDEKAQKKFMKTLAAELQKLPCKLILFYITTHGEQERGDLSCCTSWAVTVKDFFEAVVTEPMRKLLRTKYVMCFMLVCGGLVGHSESSSDLKAIFKSYNFRHLFAFTVPSLIPTLLCSLFLDLVQRVVVEGHSIVTFIDELVRTAPLAARHTAIIHMMQDEEQKAQTMVKYVWAHPKIQPWGQTLPHQCDKCFAFRSWVYFAGPGDSHSFRCSHCAISMIFNPPTETWESIKKSEWIKIAWE